MSAENSFLMTEEDHNPVEVKWRNLMVQNYLNLEITQERGNYIVVIIGDATYSGKENLKNHKWTKH
jgi:hypothetical protein